MKTHCPWRFPGQYEDEETGLYYNRFRYYDPSIGRYISQDPLGLLGGFWLYGYTADPFRFTDALGLIGCDKNTRQTRELLDEEILDHVFDRHAADFLGDLANKGDDLGRLKAILDRLRKSNLTFYSNLGGTQVIGHLARWEGKYAAIYFFRDGPHAGKVASAFLPTQKQLSRIFGTMSRHGP
jgi:RHS repeat-associated protein